MTQRAKWKSAVEYPKVTLSNKARKPAYRLNKMILCENGDLYFVKMAESEKAKNFLNEIRKREESASKAFGDLAVVIKGELREEKLYYPYIEHSSLEEIVKKNILSDSLLMGKQEIEKYITFIEKIPQVNIVPEKFYETFEIKTGGSDVFRCIKFGCIDCIPCNILVNGEEWYIIDNEWFFDFPVPIDFIIFRGLSSLIINLQDEIQKMMAKEMRCTIFSGYGNKKNYVPITWVDFFEDIGIPLQKLSEWNMKFQRKVLYEGRPYRIRLKERPRLYIDTSSKTGKVKNDLIWRYRKFKFNINELKSIVLDGIGEFIYHIKPR